MQYSFTVIHLDKEHRSIQFLVPGNLSSFMLIISPSRLRYPATRFALTISHFYHPTYTHQPPFLKTHPIAHPITKTIQQIRPSHIRSHHPNPTHLEIRLTTQHILNDLAGTTTDQTRGSHTQLIM